MDNQSRFKLKTFLYYIVIEPWTEKVSLPNFRTLIWVLIIAASIFKLKYLLFISLILGVVLHLVYEYKSGKFIYWYKKYKRKKFGKLEEPLELKDEESKDEERDLSKMPQ